MTAGLCGEGTVARETSGNGSRDASELEVYSTVLVFDGIVRGERNIVLGLAAEYFVVTQIGERDSILYE